MFGTLLLAYFPLYPVYVPYPVFVPVRPRGNTSANVRAAESRYYRSLYPEPKRTYKKSIQQDVINFMP
jgi:hypothetical protein